MPLAALDPSLALGFYLRTQDDLDDLCARIEALTGGCGVGGGGGGAGSSNPPPSLSSARCPLLTVSHGDAAGAAEGWAVRQRLRGLEEEMTAKEEVDAEVTAAAGGEGKPPSAADAAARRRRRRRPRGGGRGGGGASSPSMLQGEEADDDDWELV